MTMKIGLIAVLVLAVNTYGQEKPKVIVPTSNAWDVAALEYTTPPSHPCNIAPKSNGGPVFAVCITGDETHWKCIDSRRVMLTSEDGARHCILFPPQEPQVVEVRAK
jgi:hypothetical protein